MKIIVEIEFGGYQRFLAECDPTRREYQVLRNGAEIRDSVDGRVVVILCETDEANALLDLAKLICPEVVLDIVASINLGRRP